MDAMLQQRNEITQLEINDSNFDDSVKNMAVKISDKDQQFKKRRLSMKLEKLREKAHDNPPLNIFGQRTGQTLTPLMMDWVKLGLCYKAENLEPIQAELHKRGVPFPLGMAFNKLKKFLKSDKKAQIIGDSKHNEVISFPSHNMTASLGSLVTTTSNGWSICLYLLKIVKLDVCKIATMVYTTICV